MDENYNKQIRRENISDDPVIVKLRTERDQARKDVLRMEHAAQDANARADRYKTALQELKTLTVKNGKVSCVAMATIVDDALDLSTEALQQLLAEADGGADFSMSGQDSPGQVAARKALKKHVCKEDKTCHCYILAEEPEEDCPVHGYPYPPRCDCGKFLKRKVE